MTRTRQNQSVNVATAGVALIAAVAFIISYSALQRTAAANGFPGWQSWLWPLLIDMPILVFAFTSLVIGWMTNRRSWFATSMIVLFSGATIMFNLAHAEMHWLHYAVAIMPPLALIVSFEALRELIQIVAVQQLPATAPETMQQLPVPETMQQLPDAPETAAVTAPAQPVPEAAPKPQPQVSLTQALAAVLQVAESYGATTKQQRSIKTELQNRAAEFPMAQDVLLAEVRSIAKDNGVPSFVLGSLVNKVSAALIASEPEAAPEPAAEPEAVETEPVTAEALEPAPAPAPVSESEPVVLWPEWSAEERYQRLAPLVAGGKTWRQVAEIVGGKESAVKSWWYRNQPDAVATGNLNGGSA